jgi:hypothetical protein
MPVILIPPDRHPQLFREAAAHWVNIHSISPLILQVLLAVRDGLDNQAQAYQLVPTMASLA